MAEFFKRSAPTPAPIVETPEPEPDAGDAIARVVTNADLEAWTATLTRVRHDIRGGCSWGQADDLDGVLSDLIRDMGQRD